MKIGNYRIYPLLFIPLGLLVWPLVIIGIVWLFSKMSSTGRKIVAGSFVATIVALTVLGMFAASWDSQHINQTEPIFVSNEDGPGQAIPSN